MQFKIRSTPIGHDIPLASVHVKEVLSNDAVQLIDFSDMMENNMTSSVKQMSSSPKYTDGTTYEDQFTLRAKSGFGNIELTDEYHYNRQTGAVTPLWYLHSLQRTYYNPDSSLKTMRRKIRSGSEQGDRVITALIPATGSQIIMGDSVSVKKTAGTGLGFLLYNQYKVDYGEGSLILLADYAETDSEFEIKYILVPIDLTITTFDYSPYRVEIWPAAYSLCTSCFGSGCVDCRGKGRDMYENHYTTSILSTSKEQMLVSYRSYTTSTRVEEVTERTNFSALYNSVEEEVRSGTVYDILNDWEIDPVKTRVYSRIIDESDYHDEIRITTDNPDVKYSFRPDTKYNTKIRIVKPYSLGFNMDWYPVVTPAAIKLNDGSTYDTRIEDRIQSSVTEDATVVNPTTLSVSVGNINAMYTNDFGWYGVIVSKADGSTIGVESVDLRNGLITIEDEVSRRERITVSYLSDPTGKEVKEVCLNPLETHLYHNYDVVDNMFLYILAPEGEGDPPVYVKVLAKYTNDILTSYSYSSIDNVLNSENPSIRAAYRADIISIPSELVTSEARMEPLAIAYVINPLDEDGYLVEDARLFGGGTPLKHRSFYDHSYFDGEAIDMESYLVYKFPVWIYDDLVERALLWDPDTITADSPSDYAKEAARALIQAKVKKFSQLGTRQEITIE